MQLDAERTEVVKCITENALADQEQQLMSNGQGDDQSVISMVRNIIS